MKKCTVVMKIILFSLVLMCFYSCVSEPKPKSPKHGVFAFYIRYFNQSGLNNRTDNYKSAVKVSVENSKTGQKKSIIAYYSNQVLFIYNLKTGTYRINDIIAMHTYYKRGLQIVKTVDHGPFMPALSHREFVTKIRVKKKSILNGEFSPEFKIDPDGLLFYGTIIINLELDTGPYDLEKRYPDVIKGGTIVYRKPDEITINQTKKAVEELGIESMWPGVQFKVFELSE